MDEKNSLTVVKFILVGESSVGKSNLLFRFTNGKFREDHHPTIGVDFESREIILDNEKYKIQLFDTSGLQNFREIVCSYYEKCACALFVYDINKKESFDNINGWIADCKKNNSDAILMVLVGNKCDLEDCREVTEEEGKDFADKNGMLFFETSAKTGKNVEEVFKQATANIAQKIKEGFYDLEDGSYSCGIKKSEQPSIDIGRTFSKDGEKSGCCS